MVLSLLVLPGVTFGQWSSGYLPYVNETTGFNYEGTRIFIITKISLEGDKVNVGINDGKVLITPLDLNAPIPRNLEFSVTLAGLSGQSRVFSRKKKLSVSDESVKGSQQLVYLRFGSPQAVSHDPSTGTGYGATLRFMVRENGKGTVFIGYKTTEKEDKGEVTFDPSNAVAIYYEVKGFLGEEELEWDKCKEKGLSCVCAYATAKKKYSDQATSAIKWEQESDWYNAQKLNTKQAYNDYIAKYNDCFCIHCDEALKLINDRGSVVPPPPPPPKNSCEEKEKALIESARRDKTIIGYEAYLDFAKKCVGRFVQEATTAIQELQPIILDGGISSPDSEGWQTLQFRNMVSPAYTPSPGLIVDDTRFMDELLLRVKMIEGDNYEIEVWDKKFPNKPSFKKNLNNIAEIEFSNDSLAIILTIEKGRPPYVIKLIDREFGKVAWQRSGVNPGTITINKETELNDLNGEFELHVYEQGYAQPILRRDIFFDRGKNKFLICLAIGAVCIIFLIVMGFLLWRNYYKKKQTPWFQDQN